MPSFINTNIASLNAQRNLNTSQTALQTSLQRLSSGLRINSAKDDAAGLAISSRLTAQINGNTQAARNASDGISLAQTAEGDLAQIGTNLQRIRDLAVQSANASNSASDRASLNNEVAALAAEIDRVAQNSSFNGVKLLDGSFTAQTFQVGAGSSAADRISINSISSARTNALGSAGATSIATKTGTAITTALSAGDLTLNGQQVGATSAGIGGGLSSSSATRIAVAINAVSAASGVTAAANSNSVTGTAATAFTAIAANTFNINGIDIGAVAVGTTAAGQGANVAAAINLSSTQTGVTASADAVTGALTLVAADGRDINIKLDGTATTSALATSTKNTFLTQTGLASGVVGEQAATAVAGSVITAGTITATPPFTGTTLSSGALTANGASIGAVTFATVANTAASAVTAGTAGSTVTLGTLTSGDTYTLAITGSSAGPVTFTSTGNTTTDATNLTGLINGITAGTATSAGAVITVAAGKTLGIAVTDFRTAAQVTAGVTAALGTYAATTTAATANASAFTTAAGTGSAGVIGKQSYGGAQYSGQAFAIALNAALVSATGGAAVNGTVTNTAGTVAYVAGSTNSLQFAITGGPAADGATATANTAALVAATGLTTAQIGTQATTGTTAANHGTVTLTSSGANGIVVGGAASTSAGLTTGQTTATVTSSVNALSALNITTAAGALAALAVIDGALDNVNSSRGALGAIQNRFASVVTSLQTTSENLTASRSRILDTDFAAETSALTRSQILQQAGTAMLAQANQVPNTVLTLLR